MKKRTLKKITSITDHLHPISRLYKRQPGANKDVRLLLYLNHHQYHQYLVPLLINYLLTKNEPDFSITFCHPWTHFLGHLRCC